MRFRPDWHGCALLPLVTFIAAGLGGCDKLAPNGASTTVALLRAGSEKACVAPDVQELLRGLVIPKPADLGSGASDVDVRDAVAKLSLTFDTTTLEATDKSVSRVTCDTVAHVFSPQGQAGKYRISYQVSPSAENANAVVVSGDTEDVRTFAKVRIEEILTAQDVAKNQQQQAAQDAQARQQLLSLLTPKWLVGTWIETGTDAARCSNGQGFAFRANHVVEGTELFGRWALTADHLHAVGQGAGGAADIDGTVTTADPVSFTLTTKDGATHGFQRCSPEEVNAGSAGLSDSFAPAPASQPAQN